MFSIVACAVVAASLVAITACEQKSTGPSAPNGDTEHGHEHGPGGEHAENTAGHGGPVIDLGATTIGPFDAKATRDEGQIIAGKDAPIDVTLTPSAGSTVRATAVRFWIGTEDAKGSVKARAEVENPAEPNRWHTHAEIPNPLPEGSKLWVEIEDDQGGTSTGSFPLNM